MGLGSFEEIKIIINMRAAGMRRERETNDNEFYEIPQYCSEQFIDRVKLDDIRVERIVIAVRALDPIASERVAPQVHSSQRVIVSSRFHYNTIKNYANNRHLVIA